MTSMHGGQIIARALKQRGVQAVFALTGGHIVPILDGCVLEGISVVDVRHEQAAAHAAEAYTRLTGNLGTALVTAGPGVTGTITAVASAWHSRTPMLVIGGRHYVRQEQKGGLQEMDHPQLFRSITAWAGTAWETNRLAEYVALAADHAFAGRGGPVFLDIPLDVQADMVREDAVSWPVVASRRHAAASLEDLTQVTDALQRADRPVVFAGGGLRPHAADSLRPFAEALQAPVFVNGAARGALPHGHPLLGSRTRSQAFAGADLVLALGVDWDFRTGYGRKIATGAVVAQVDAETTRIGWNRPVDIGIVADPAIVLRQLGELADRYARTELPTWTKELMAAEEEAAAAAEARGADESPVHPERFAREVAEFFGEDSIVAVDGGDIVSTTAKWLRVSHPGHVLDPGPFGTLGTGAPFALAAKVAHPDKLVGIVYGDGGFGFNGFEFDTFIRHRLPVIGVIGNDGVWNNIKSFHKAFFPDRLVAADLGVRPYHDMVAGLGGYGEFVDRPDEIRPALERAKASGKPALINVHIAETFRASSNYQQ